MGVVSEKLIAEEQRRSEQNDGNEPASTESKGNKPKEAKGTMTRQQHTIEEFLKTQQQSKDVDAKKQASDKKSADYSRLMDQMSSMRAEQFNDPKILQLIKEKYPTVDTNTIFEKVTQWKKYKAYFGKFSSNAKLPEKDKIKANEIGMKPENYQNMLLGGAEDLFSIVHRSAVATGTAKPESQFGGIAAADALEKKAAADKATTDAANKKLARDQENWQKDFDQGVEEFNKTHDIALKKIETDKIQFFSKEARLAIKDNTSIADGLKGSYDLMQKQDPALYKKLVNEIPVLGYEKILTDLQEVKDNNPKLTREQASQKLTTGFLHTNPKDLDSLDIAMDLVFGKIGVKGDSGKGEGFNIIECAEASKKAANEKEAGVIKNIDTLMSEWSTINNKLVSDVKVGSESVLSANDKVALKKRRDTLKKKIDTLEGKLKGNKFKQFINGLKKIYNQAHDV